MCLIDVNYLGAGITSGNCNNPSSHYVKVVNTIFANVLFKNVIYTSVDRIDVAAVVIC